MLKVKILESQIIKSCWEQENQIIGSKHDSEILLRSSIPEVGEP